jgi:hypothetical protein
MVFSPRLRMWWRIVFGLGIASVVLFVMGIALATTSVSYWIIAIDWVLFSVLFIGAIVGFLWTLCKLVGVASRPTRR